MTNRYRLTRLVIICLTAIIALAYICAPGVDEDPSPSPALTITTTPTTAPTYIAPPPSSGGTLYGATFWYDGGAEDSGIEVYPDGAGVQYDGGQEVRTFPAGTFWYPMMDEDICFEDMPCWECEVMGNRSCGKE
jgi:hypothetical protein